MKFLHKREKPEEKTFLLGVGAQKSGTTWLQAYISTDKKVATGPLKEYHIWEAIYIKQCSNFRVTDEQRTNAPADDLKWHLQQNTDRYFSFFADLMESRNAEMTFDITPEYSALPVDVLQMIRSKFQQRNIRTKTIFLMRDPIERCWSAARMYLNHSRGTTAVTPDEVLYYATTTSAALRGRYDLTIRNLYRAFDSDSVYIGFYEQMFQKDRIDELSRISAILKSSTRWRKRNSIRAQKSQSWTSIQKRKLPGTTNRSTTSSQNIIPTHARFGKVMNFFDRGPGIAAPLCSVRAFLLRKDRCSCIGVAATPGAVIRRERFKRGGQ